MSATPDSSPPALSPKWVARGRRGESVAVSFGHVSCFMLRRVAASAREPLIMLDNPRDTMQHEKGRSVKAALPLIIDLAGAGGGNRTRTDL